MLAAVPAAATSWDYTGDCATPFPQTGNGPGNAWFYYQAAPDDRDGLYTLFCCPVANFGGSYIAPASGIHIVASTFVHPGGANFVFAPSPEPDVVVAFRAPSAAVYNVLGLFSDNDGTDSAGATDQRGVQVEVTTTATPGVAGSDQSISAFAPAFLDASNTNEAMRVLLGGPNPLPTLAAFDFAISLAAGQNLFFRVNDFGSSLCDGTGLSIQITDVAAVPEPSTLLLLGTGLIALIVRAKKMMAAKTGVGLEWH